MQYEMYHAISQRDWQRRLRRRKWEYVRKSVAFLLAFTAVMMAYDWTTDQISILLLPENTTMPWILKFLVKAVGTLVSGGISSWILAICKIPDALDTLIHLTDQIKVWNRVSKTKRYTSYINQKNLQEVENSGKP